ncbi:MAG: hypothetical protein EHM41_00055 [Chloroflexi bacterium]|nr:MAG: hypothetical protein EHM41_00055 [Chloroflexota bacterium]
MAEIEIDRWNFSGDEEFNTTIGNSAVSDQSASYREIKYGVTRLTSSDHGYKVSPAIYGPEPGNLIFVQGTTNYEGLRKIVAVGTDTLDIIAKFVAETPGGTETLRPGFKCDTDVKFLGFELHLDSASATVEDLEIHVDADRGAAWDRKLYDLAMNGIKDYIEIFDPPIVIPAKDIVYCTWANTNDRLWGLTLLTQRLA